MARQMISPPTETGTVSRFQFGIINRRYEERKFLSVTLFHDLALILLENTRTGYFERSLCLPSPVK